MIRKSMRGKITGVFGVCLAFAGIFAGLLAGGEDKQKQDLETDKTEGTVEVHYIDVGQGDSTLIICNDEAMLIDAGDNGEGKNVCDYLESRNISELEYLIGTHPDSDHVGGMDNVIENVPCENIFMSDFVKDTVTYTEVIEAAEEKGYDIQVPEVGNTYNLGGGQFTIIAPNDTYSDANNSSIGILFEFESTSFLFTGDAEEEAELDILENGIDISADVYKAGHHGSRTASDERLLERVNPSYVVISCGEDNTYGHPHAAILNYCRMNGIDIYRTDKQGTLVAVSDGKDIQWNMAPGEAY